MKPYRLKHLPTGLYLDVKSKKPRLNETGKIYTSGINSLNWDPYSDDIVVDTDLGYKCYRKADFVKVGVKIEDVLYENA